MKGGGVGQGETSKEGGASQGRAAKEGGVGRGEAAKEEASAQRKVDRAKCNGPCGEWKP